MRNGTAALLALAAALVLAGGAGAAAWTPSKQLSAGSDDAGAPWVAVAPNGMTTVAWEQEIGSISLVRGRRWSATGKPGPLLKLSPPGEGVGVLRVETADTGATFVSWLNQETSRIQVRRIAAGGKVGPIRSLSPAGASSQGPDLAVAPDGRAVVSWFRYDGGTSWTILARRIAANGKPSATTLTLGTTAGYPVGTNVAIARTGGAVVAWQGTDGANTRVLARRIRSNGALAGALPALSAAGQDTFSPSLGIAGDGTATVAWARSDGSSLIAQARRIAPNGALGSVLPLSASGQHAFGPVVAVSGEGVAIAAWTRSNGTNSIVQSRRIAANGALGAVRNRSAAGRDADGATVAGSAGGTVFLGWHRWNGTHVVVQAVRLTRRGTAGPVRNVSPATQDGQWPALGLSSTGVAAAAWYAGTGTHDDVFASRYLLDRPTTSIVGAGVDPAGRAASFRFRGVAGAGTRTFQCRLRGTGATRAQRAWSRCRSAKRYAGLRPSSYVFQVRARDQSGRVDATPARRSFRIG